MSRMKQAGYHEDYRKHVLLNALAVYDKKIRDDLDGVCPLNRPAGYQKIQRRKEKVLKKKNWSTKGGYLAPIMVPATPNGELARMLKEVAEAENECGIKFKIIEKGGKTIEKQLQNPNPTSSGNVEKEIVLLTTNLVVESYATRAMYCMSGNAKNVKVFILVKQVETVTQDQKSI